MTPPAVAILTPCFGHAQYLGDMLRSLQAQDVVNWECCVVIDGEDMDAARACDLRDPRIRVVMLHDRHGPAYCRNLAVKYTSAPWLLSFDADDLMEPGYLAALLDWGNDANSDPKQMPVVYTAARCLMPNGDVSVFRYPPFDPTQFTERFQIPNASLQPRALWRQLGGWDETWTEGAEDWHYWTRAVANDWIMPVNLAAPLWTYREHEGERHSRVGRANFTEHKRIMDQILDDARKGRRPAPETTRQAPPTTIGPRPPIQRSPGGANEPPDRAPRPGP